MPGIVAPFVPRIPRPSREKYSSRAVQLGFRRTTPIFGQFATVCHYPAWPGAGRHEIANQQPINNNRHQVDSVSIRLLSGLVTLCPSCKTVGSLGLLGNSRHPQVGASMAGYVIHMPSFCQPFVSPLSVFSHAAQVGILAGILPPSRGFASSGRRRRAG